MLTPQEVADLFRVSRRTVYRWVRAGKLVAMPTPGGHWRVSGEQVRRLWESLVLGSENPRQDP